MNGAYFEFPQMLMSSFTLACSACVAWLLLTWIKPSSHRIHRIVWFAVLLNCIFLVRFSVDIPVLRPDSPLAVSLMGQLDPELTNRQANSFSHTAELDYVQPDAAVLEPDESQRLRSLPTDTLSTVVNGPSIESAANVADGPTFSLTGILRFVWAAGFSAALCLIALRYLLFLRRMSGADAARKTWTDQVRQLSRSAGIKQDIPLLEHATLGPALVLTPRGYRIVIPSLFWSKLNDTQRHAILSHELAHLQRGDIWKSMCTTLLASTHWFNPFAWLAVRKFNEAAEWACDQAVGMRDSLVRADYARALLSLSAADYRWLLGTSSFGSSGMTSRIRRLFASPAKDSVWGQLTICVLVSLIVAVGWVNVRLVTAAGPLPTTRLSSLQDEEQTNEPLKQLQQQLSQSEDELSMSLATALNTEAGRIALINRITGVEEDLRNEAAKQAIPEFFESQIDSQFTERLDREIKEAQDDIAQLGKALSQLRDKLAGTSEADRLLIRFLETENAPQVFYFSQLRRGLRPSVELVMQQSLGRVLTDDGSGRLVVRESAKSQLEKQLSQIDEIEKQMEFVRSELIEWSSEIVPQDDFHKKIKEGLMNPTGHVYLFAQLIREGGNPRQVTERYFEFLEGLFVDIPEGLIIPEERIEEVKESVAESERLKAKANSLRNPIRKIVDLIDSESSDAAPLAKQFLQSDLGIAFVAMQTNINTANADEFLAEITRRVMEENEEGELVVREEKLEEVTNFAREMLSNRRRLRRRGRFLGPHLENLKDPSLRTLCKSLEGQMLMIENIREFASAKRFDGWPLWIQDHLDQTPDGYVVRDEARQEIKELLTEVAEINKELAKDDF